ncbi:MAG TPA: PIG-L family deacetylase [Acidimicrobiales bacterium]|nr:PIG-L family deacetylase [Acidimicrobiales bacterium]
MSEPIASGPSPMSRFGWVDEAELARVVVLSPHLDDGVLSCGMFLAAHPGTTVVTVFCGFPAMILDPPNWWSQISGFGPGEDVVAARRAEDERALARLGAQPRHLDGFPERDLQPDEPVATASQVADALAGVIAELEPTLVLVPMGLANPEHVCVHDAALLVRTRLGDEGPSWIAYQDVAYHQIPGQLAWRVAKLFKAAVWPTPVAMPTAVDPTPKRDAVAEYTSQVKALEADWGLWRRLDAPTPEQYWRLAPPPAGWEALIDLV